MQFSISCKFLHFSTNLWGDDPARLATLFTDYLKDTLSAWIYVTEKKIKQLSILSLARRKKACIKNN